jgi:hypothetical protein
MVVPNQHAYLQERWMSELQRLHSLDLSTLFGLVGASRKQSFIRLRIGQSRRHSQRFLAHTSKVYSMWKQLATQVEESLQSWVRLPKMRA